MAIIDKDLKKKKLKDKSNNKISFFSVNYQGQSIAEIKVYYDYVKAKETDRIRTKLSKLQDVNFNKEAIKQIFPKSNLEQLEDIIKLTPKDGAVLWWISHELNKVINS